ARGDGRLTVVTCPDRARVVIKPYELANRYLTVNEERALVEAAPIRELRLQRGSYLLLLTAPGCHEVRYPVMIGRAEHWDGVRPGDSEPCPIRLLQTHELSADDVYVPAGWFIAGGDPRAGESLPRRRVWVDAFVMQRAPVTNGAYVEFLNALM